MKEKTIEQLKSQLENIHEKMLLKISYVIENRDRIVRVERKDLDELTFDLSCSELVAYYDEGHDYENIYVSMHSSLEDAVKKYFLHIDMHISKGTHHYDKITKMIDHLKLFNVDIPEKYIETLKGWKEKKSIIIKYNIRKKIEELQKQSDELDKPTLY